MDKLTVRDLEAKDKRVFVRVDFNVPLEDGKVTDDSRIRASLPTIVHLLSQGAKVVLASHLGRPDGKVQDGLRLRPVGERLSLLLRRNVPVTGDALGPGTEDAIKRIRPGEALLLENLRFHAEEEKNDPQFAATLASYADAYVNDAFGTAHRAHASTVGVPKLLPAYAGLLMEREIRALSKLLESPEHPYAAIVGGAKVSGKLKVLDNLLTRVDVLILGGGMANTFLLAQGKAVGKSLAEHDMVEEARRLLAKAEKRDVRVVLPVDVIVAKEVTRGTEYKTLPAEKIPASWHIVDVGRQTLELIEDALRDVRTVVWNGPIGVFEIPVFGAGTRHVARILAEKAQAGATVVVGGGDSVAALQQQGLANQMTHISTGGGASLEFLEGRDLPGIAVLLDRPPEGVAVEPKATAPAEPEPADDVPPPRPFLSQPPPLPPPPIPVPYVAAAIVAQAAATAATPRATSPTASAAASTAAASKPASPAPRPAGPSASPPRAAAPPSRKPVMKPAGNRAAKPTAKRAASQKAGPVRKASRPAPRVKAPGKPRPATATRKPAVRKPVRPAGRKPAAAKGRSTLLTKKAAPVRPTARKPIAKPIAAKSKRAAPSKKAVAVKKPAASKRPATTKKPVAVRKPAATGKGPATKPKPAPKPPAPKRPASKRPGSNRPAPKRPAIKRPAPARRSPPARRKTKR